MSKVSKEKILLKSLKNEDNQKMKKLRNPEQNKEFDNDKSINILIGTKH